VRTGTDPMITAGDADRMGAMTADVPAPVRDPAWSLSRSAIGLWVTEGVIGTLVYGALVAAFVLFVPDGGPVPVLRWLLPALLVVYAGTAIGIRPWVRYRVHRWEVTGEAVYTLTGWLTRTWTLVPISRIQTVDVTRGVLQQLFGLATVAVLTASSQGTVRVLHLEADVAQRVADDLARRAELVRDEAT
jgi:membrane protein YdbS with pleckstrin-like domain